MVTRGVVKRPIKTKKTQLKRRLTLSKPVAVEAIPSKITEPRCTCHAVMNGPVVDMLSKETMDVSNVRKGLAFIRDSIRAHTREKPLCTSQVIGHWESDGKQQKIVFYCDEEPANSIVVGVSPQRLLSIEGFSLLYMISWLNRRRKRT